MSQQKKFEERLESSSFPCQPGGSLVVDLNVALECVEDCWQAAKPTPESLERAAWRIAQEILRNSAWTDEKRVLEILHEAAQPNAESQNIAGRGDAAEWEQNKAGWFKLATPPLQVQNGLQMNDAEITSFGKLATQVQPEPTEHLIRTFNHELLERAARKIADECIRYQGDDFAVRVLEILQGQ